MKKILSLPALRVRQSNSRVLYTFAIDGKTIHKFATISRAKRPDNNKIMGYQRPEAAKHIQEIRNYLESSDPMVPNSIVIAFKETVVFKPISKNGLFSEHGYLEIPVDDKVNEEDKPGWIVDGQQRAAAIRESNLESFPICATAFITSDDHLQREQFILVNSTKPLNKSLIYELLPETDALLPSQFQRKKFPSLLLNELNSNTKSIFKGMIKTSTCPTGIVKDNSMLRIIENSLADGALYKFYDALKNEADTKGMFNLLNNFWTAVSITWPDAWGQPPKKSRLLHGTGISSLGFIMDSISGKHRTDVPSVKDYQKGLEVIMDVCKWTSGFWDFGGGTIIKWNEIQNTSRDMNLMANYLLMLYRKN